MWEIEQTPYVDPGIICLKLEAGKIIRWDFALGSRYCLCALFPQMDDETLEDYRQERKRPILYHKNLCLSHRILASETTVGYALYPALIEDGVLYISNQRQPICLKRKVKEVAIHIKREKRKRWKFWWSRQFEEIDYNIELPEGNENTAKIYYIFQGGNDNHVYSGRIDEHGLTINIKEGTKIVFYADEKCMKELKVN